MTSSLGDRVFEMPFFAGNVLSQRTTKLISSINICFGMVWYGSPETVALVHYFITCRQLLTSRTCSELAVVFTTTLDKCPLRRSN